MHNKKEIENNIQTALSLRKVDGLVYSDIALKMGRPLGTIKRWLRPYAIKTEASKQKAKVAAAKGSMVMQQNYKTKRKEAYDLACSTLKDDLQDPLLRDFVNLYIGEGAKKGTNGISIVNSDPEIMFLSLSIMKKYFLKDKKQIVLSIKYYENNNNEKQLLAYWQNLLKNNSSIVFKTYLQTTTKPTGHNNSNKFGLIIASIHDVYAKEKLQAYMDYLKDSWIEKFESEFNTVLDRSIKEVKSS